MSKITYRVVLGDEKYQFIGFYHWYIHLAQCNERPANCIECKQDFLPGQCVYMREKGGKKGYVCIPCTQKLIRKHGPVGYHVTPLFNLQAADTITGRITADQVAGSIYAFNQTVNENGVTILEPFGDLHG